MLYIRIAALLFNEPVCRDQRTWEFHQIKYEMLMRCVILRFGILGWSRQMAREIPTRFFDYGTLPSEIQFPVPVRASTKRQN